MDKKDLKIQALLERVSELTRTYENRLADLRVEVTTLSVEADNRNSEIERLQDELVQAQERTEGDSEPDAPA